MVTICLSVMDSPDNMWGRVGLAGPTGCIFVRLSHTRVVNERVVAVLFRDPHGEKAEQS